MALRGRPLAYLLPSFAAVYLLVGLPPWLASVELHAPVLTTVGVHSLPSPSPSPSGYAVLLPILYTPVVTYRNSSTSCARARPSHTAAADGKQQGGETHPPPTTADDRREGEVRPAPPRRQGPRGQNPSAQARRPSPPDPPQPHHPHHRTKPPAHGGRRRGQAPQTAEPPAAEKWGKHWGDGEGARARSTRGPVCYFVNPFRLGCGRQPRTHPSRVIPREDP